MMGLRESVYWVSWLMTYAGMSAATSVILVSGSIFAIPEKEQIVLQSLNNFLDEFNSFHLLLSAKISVLKPVVLSCIPQRPVSIGIQQSICGCLMHLLRFFP